MSLPPAIKALNKARLKKLQDAKDATSEALQHEESARALREYVARLHDDAAQIETAIGTLGGEVIDDRNDERLAG